MKQSPWLLVEKFQGAQGGPISVRGWQEWMASEGWEKSPSELANGSIMQMKGGAEPARTLTSRIAARGGEDTS